MPSSSSGAAHHALGIVEILETILLNLDYSDILYSERVSKHFKVVIDGSLALQKALWRAPRRMEVLEIDYKADREKNPFPHVEVHPFLTSLRFGGTAVMEKKGVCFKIDGDCDSIHQKLEKADNLPLRWRLMPGTRPAITFGFYSSPRSRCKTCGSKAKASWKHPDLEVKVVTLHDILLITRCHLSYMSKSHPFPRSLPEDRSQGGKGQEADWYCKHVHPSLRRTKKTECGTCVCGSDSQRTEYEVGFRMPISLFNSYS